jgi:hypothetical protein
MASNERNERFGRTAIWPQSWLAATEAGLKEPSATILFRIAMLYGKATEWLVTGSEGGVE